MDFLKGRTNRASYWLLIGILAAVIVGIGLLTSGAPRVSEVMLILICVPRLHDIGQSGWWVLCGIALEIAGIAAMFIVPAYGGMVMALMTLGIAGLVVALGVVPGQPFDNRFGRPPGPGLSVGRPSKSRADVFD